MSATLYFIPYSQTRTSCLLSASQTVCSLSRSEPNVAFYVAWFANRVYYTTPIVNLFQVKIYTNFIIKKNLIYAKIFLA